MAIFDGTLICTDLDGTLLRKDKTISKENLDAIEYFKANGGYFATGAVKKITMFSDARTASEIETDRTKMDLDDDHIMVALDLTVANMKEGDIRNYADLTNPLYAPGIKFNSGELYQIVGRLKSIPRTIETVIQQGPSDNTEGWIASNFRTNSYPAWGVKLLSNGNIYLYTNHLEKNANGSNRSVERSLLSRVLTCVHTRISILQSRWIITMLTYMWMAS